MGYVVRSMCPEDREAVFRLQAENLSGLRHSVGPDRYRWSHETNPSGSPETIVALHGESGPVVACGSLYPREVRVDGRALEIGIPADFAVARAHRLGGAALAVQRAILDAATARFAFILAYPNQGALPIFNRVGYVAIGGATVWVKPLRADYKLRSFLKSRHLATFAAAPANAILRSYDSWRRRNAQRLKEEVVVFADERFDHLWIRARDQHPATGVRTATYLNWRYRTGPDSGTRFFCLTSVDTAELFGYAAYRIDGDKVFVDDMLAVDMGGGIERLLLLFSDFLRRQRYQSICIEYAGSADASVRFQRAGFVRRPSSNRILVGAALSDPYKSLLDKQRWYLFESEMDL